MNKIENISSNTAENSANLKPEQLPLPEYPSEMQTVINQIKINLVKTLYQLECSPEEKMAFSKWLEKIPPDISLKNPLPVNNIETILAMLPTVPNNREKALSFFYTKTNFSDQELHELLEKFSRTNPPYEIAVSKYNSSLISVQIGNKVKNNGPQDKSIYFGHYHPLFLSSLKETQNLPPCFEQGLLPSSGDLTGFFKHFNTIKTGTRIFSSRGCTFIKPISIKPSLISQKKLKEFKTVYFDLFLGENKFGFKTDEEVAKYFRDNFSLDIEFHYYPNPPSPSN